MPSKPLPLTAFLPSTWRRVYALAPAGSWWRVISDEGEVARYRTRAAALAGANGLAEAMRLLGLEAEVLLEDPLEPTGRTA